MSGARDVEKEEKSDRYYTYERNYGSFTRSFTLPDGADVDKLRASLDQGVLTIAVPKKPEVQPKKIAVTTEAPAPKVLTQLRGAGTGGARIEGDPPAARGGRRRASGWHAGCCSGPMLLEPLTFRNGVRARNRVWLAPMTNQQSHEDGSLSNDELLWLEMRARGGFGVIETCAAHVALDGQGWPGALGVYDDRLLPGLRRLASTLAGHVALGIVQLFHGGLRSPRSLTGHAPWSAAAYEAPGTERAWAATEEDIARVIRQFGEAAARSSTAGFAGVELHGAHGFLIGQFLSATINTRTDRWGGSLEGRARFVREIMRRVRAAVPERFVVGVRLSPEDHGNAMGLDLDESLQVARWLCADGADFIHLSLWDASSNTAKRPDQHPLPLFRDVIPRDVVLVAAGGVWTAGEAEAILQRGADAVAIGRAAIANPDWAARVSEPGWQPRRPPLTVDELRERGLNEKFAAYMRHWTGFVAGS